MDLNKVRKALGQQTITAGEPGQLDPAVGPGGGTHDTDIEISDDVVKLVDVNSPDTKDLETRAYESGTEDDGTADTPPYDGESSVDGIPTIPDTLATADGQGATPLGGPIGGTPQPEVEDPNAIMATEDADAGDAQKNKGGGGPVVTLPDTLGDELAVDPADPHASAAVALTTDDIQDLRRIMAEGADTNVDKAVKALQWLDRNKAHAQAAQVQAGLDKWQPSKAQSAEAQARYGFAFLHTQASAAPANAQKTTKVLSWLKKFVTARKIAIARNFLKSDEAKANAELAGEINKWLVTAVELGPGLTL